MASVSRFGICSETICVDIGALIRKLGDCYPCETSWCCYVVPEGTIASIVQSDPPRQHLATAHTART